MGLFDGLIQNVKSQVEYGVSREVGNAARNAVSNAIYGTTDGIKQKMEARGKWKCVCGEINTGKFCMECGKEKGEGTQCVNCGWQATTKIPRFCPECGSDFDGDENT